LAGCIVVPLCPAFDFWPEGDRCIFSVAWPEVEGWVAPGQFVGMQPDVWANVGTAPIEIPVTNAAVLTNKFFLMISPILTK
jgi:hypothetical protein